MLKFLKSKIRYRFKRYIKKHYSNSNRIEIDLTYKCSLSCYNCDRSCRQAPSIENISINQIQKFIDESIKEKRKWEEIRLLGGEPTLHPHILEIIELLLKYRNMHSNKTKIMIATNGFNKYTKKILKLIPKEIIIINSNKNGIVHNFDPINIAPIDIYRNKKLNYSNGCFIIEVCGIALTVNGYYPCGCGGAIDRVFGFNIGVKELPSKDYDFRKELNQLCKYCGHFKNNGCVKKEIMSKNWKKAYKEYSTNKPKMTKY